MSKSRSPIVTQAPSERTVLIVLPFEMTARTFGSSGICELLLRHDPQLRLVVVSRLSEDMKRFGFPESHRLVWQPLRRPFRSCSMPVSHLFHDMALAIRHFAHIAATFRFNSITRNKGFHGRLRQSRHMRELSWKEGHPSRRFLGFPFPRSRLALNFTKALAFGPWNRDANVKALFEKWTPKLVFLGHVQTSFVAPYVQEANRRSIPALGVVGSWDQPTSKGPLVPGIGKFVAPSVVNAEELNEIHHVPNEKIAVSGWPQMDLHLNTQSSPSRTDFLQKLGLPRGQRYLLFGAYADRLGSHEPDMLKQLSEAIENGELTDSLSLYIRCHPLDRNWERRLYAMHRPPHIIVEPPELGNVQHLTALIRHAEVVMSSAGTICLDAVALDKPTIVTAFEDEELPYYDRPARVFDMEHYDKLLQHGAIPIASSMRELISLLAQALKNPDEHAEERAHVREMYFSPFDGNSAQRIANFALELLPGPNL